MAFHLLLVCVAFGYAGEEENDKKREQETSGKQISCLSEV